MDIKRMHDMIETLTECAKHEFDKGIENIDTKEMGEVIDMIKDLAEAEYYRKITVAMDESEYGQDYDYEGRKGYRGQPRNSKGQYMRRRGYMQPHETYSDEELRMMQNDRDMDRQSRNVMYYADGSNMSGNRGNSESRYETAKRGYQETKQMNKDKGEKMKSLEDYMKSLAEDVTEMVNDMSQEEKSLMKQKMQVLMQKIN